MYIRPDTIKTINKLWSTKGDQYTVISNIKLESFEDAETFGEEHLPNYLIVNTYTGAIEFAVDQLPAAIQVANKLEGDLVTLKSGRDPEDPTNGVGQLQ